MWADVIRDQQHLTTALPDSVHRLAAMAMAAHELLCSYSPRHLREGARANWEQDPGTFSGWLAAFQQACTNSNLLSPASLALELIPLLQTHEVQRPKILAAGFDRLTPLQTQLFDNWGPWQQLTPEEPADQILFYEASDSQTELEACAKWCSQRAHAKPHSRQLVIAQDISLRRGEIERAFLNSRLTPQRHSSSSPLGFPLTRPPRPGRRTCYFVGLTARWKRANWIGCSRVGCRRDQGESE